jgi:hypothetical protein
MLGSGAPSYGVGGGGGSTRNSAVVVLLIFPRLGFLPFLPLFPGDPRTKRKPHLAKRNNV